MAIDISIIFKWHTLELLKLEAKLAHHQHEGYVLKYDGATRKSTRR
jgi:hypothetical protein